jgi:hypothetical protein
MLGQAAIRLDMGRSPLRAGIAGLMVAVLVGGCTSSGATPGATSRGTPAPTSSTTPTTTPAPTATPAPTPTPGPAHFGETGSMAYERMNFTATRLQDGRVLVAGGVGITFWASAELYDPATRAFSATGSMAQKRSGHTATLLNDGRVLIVGGWSGFEIYQATAELYDPATGTFSATGSMAYERSNHTATLLADGRVLVAGGHSASSGFSPLVSAEIYDPATGAFTPTGSMTQARYWHTATTLPDGRILMAGGATASAEIYDPATATFTATGSMTESRWKHVAASLLDGRVLIAGGLDGGYVVPTGETYDPNSGTFTSAGSMAETRAYGATATTLPDGRVLITGGAKNGCGSASICEPPILKLTEFFDPALDSFVATGSMWQMRQGHTATLLADGQVLVAGGAADISTRLKSAELAGF